MYITTYVYSPSLSHASSTLYNCIYAIMHLLSYHLLSFYIVVNPSPLNTNKILVQLVASLALVSANDIINWLLLYAVYM